MMRWAMITVSVAVSGMLVWIFYQGFERGWRGANLRDVPFEMKGKPAPAFTLRDLTTDKPVRLSDFAGKPVVINFWASWCGPCKLEHPNLEWAARTYGDQVVFLGMIFEDTPENARGFLARHGAGYPHLIDPNSLTAVKYGAAGVPETYFITRGGAILDKYAGPIPRGVLAERLQTLLTDDAPSAATARGAP